MTSTPSKATAGPWWTDARYDEEESGCAIIAARTDCGPLPGNPTRGMVAFATRLLPEHAEECEANARLIAAAPDMLEELRDVLEWALVEKAPLRPQEIKSIRAAISRATGEA